MHIHFWEMRDVTTTKTTKKTNQQTNKIIVDFVIYHALPFRCPRPSMCAAYVLCVGGRWFYCIHIERVCLSCNFIHSCWWKPGWVFAKFTSKSVNTQKSVVLKITCMSNHTNIEHVACVQYNSLCLCMTLDGMVWHASVSLWRDARKTRCQHFSPYVYALLLLVIWYVWDALQMQPTSALTIRPSSGVGFRKDELF